MPRVIGFGEVMLRLNPVGYRRLVQADTFEASYAGCEANALVTCANLGMDAALVTKFPDNELGRAAAGELRRFGLDTRFVQFAGPRLGVYFLETGASYRDSKVLYDRKGSSIALAKREDFDWDAIFDGAEWFHYSGITPALSDEMPAIHMDALKAAKAKGLTVSCDINFRGKLWTAQKAGEVLTPMMEYTDVCAFNETEATMVFGVKPEEGCDKYESLGRQLSEKFGLRQVAVTLSDNATADANRIGGFLYEGGKPYYSPLRDVHIIDRVGAGDCYTGALIWAALEGFDPQHAVNFATAACCLKCTEPFDFNHETFAEIEKLASGGGEGGPQR